MTKSFTALAILKLRDEGKLSLEDPVSKWIPEFARMELPTRDTPPLQRPTAAEPQRGIPGGQSVGRSAAERDGRGAGSSGCAKGIPFSTPPGTRYEYSNYAFGLLGRVVDEGARHAVRAVHAGARSWRSCSMDATTFEFSDIPAASRAVGYRLKPDGTYARSRRCRTAFSAPWAAC